MTSTFRALTSLLAAIAMLAIAVWPAAAKSPSPRAIDAVDRIFTEAESHGIVGGMTVGIVAERDLVWTKSYGFADAEAKIPANRNTVYRIGSITKQVTALMLLRLVEQGRMSLGDPVERYVPELNAVQSRWVDRPQPTLRELAMHRAGISDFPSDASFFSGSNAQWERTTIEALKTVSYLHQPGERFGYSNIGYAVLGLALGRAAGEPYATYIEQRILAPLGMNSTRFEPTPVMRETLAKGYLVRPTGVDSSASSRELEFGRGFRIPNGALFSTVDDLARFLAFQMGFGPEDVLAAAKVAANFEKSEPTESWFGVSAGIGFLARPAGAHRVFGHPGEVPGYSADAYFDPVSKLGIIYLRNAAYTSVSPDSTRALRAIEALLETP